MFLGPVIFGLVLGLIIGSQIKLNNNDTRFTISSFLVICIAAVIMAWQLGQYPFYNDSPISTAFILTLVGIFAGKLLFARES